MNLEELTQNVPLNIDVFTLIIFLGTVQGFFLSYFYLSKPNRELKSNLYTGLLLLAISFIMVDITLSYSYAMFKVLHLVDASEPFNLLIGPLFYLFIVSKLDESKKRKIYYHFIPFISYACYLTLFLVQDISVKYNSYIDQYHPDRAYLPISEGSFSDPILLKGFINELTIISILVYLIAAIFVVYRSSKKERLDDNRKKLYSFLWFNLNFMVVIISVIIFVKVTFAHDLGDYLIISVLTIYIYASTFKLIKESLLFSKGQFEKKYSKSALDEDTKTKILEKLLNEFEKEKYYLKTSPTLPELSKNIGYSQNHVSQVINEKIKMNFPELIAKYRIEEAKILLLDPSNNETIEGIAYSVGYNSKSTFHTAFKKFTGQTPAEFKSANQN
jgi:AraC-like DNA-binding protein